MTNYDVNLVSRHQFFLLGKYIIWYLQMRNADRIFVSEINFYNAAAILFVFIFVFFWFCDPKAFSLSNNVLRPNFFYAFED